MKRKKRDLTPRVFTKNFPEGFDKVKDKCFVPLTDYRALERKYEWMFKRLQKCKKQSKEQSN
jgi:hypothetical protein